MTSALVSPSSIRTHAPGFSRRVLDRDPSEMLGEISTAVCAQLQTLRRRGAVLGLSGGVDSSVVGAILVRAIGPDRVLGLLMPERDSSADSSRLGRLVASELGIETLVEDIGPALE